MSRFLPLLAVLVGCGGESLEDWPDLRGRYSVQLTSTRGCEGASTHFQWLNGPLFITGEVPDLDFDFADGFEFSGSSTATGRFTFTGSVDADLDEEIVYSVVSSGTAVDRSGRYELDGTVDITFDGDEDCQFAGTFLATQVAS